MKLTKKMLLLGSFMLFSSLFLLSSIGEAKESKLISLKVGKTYSSYDVTSDGKKDRIKIKQTKTYMDDMETEYRIRINNTDTVIATGYKGVDVMIYSYGKKSTLIYESIAGTAASSVMLLNYSGGKFRKKEVFWPGGWSSYSVAGNNSLIIKSYPKGAWWCKSLEKLKDNSFVPFEVESRYVFKGYKLVKKTGFKNVSGTQKYKVKKNIKTGKTLKTATKKNGFSLKRNSVFILKQVVYRKNTYYYKIKYKNKTGWIKDSYSNRFYPV